MNKSTAHDLPENVNAAERGKIKKYAVHMNELTGRLDFSPFGISSFGATGCHAKEVLRFLIQRIHKTHLIPSEIAHYYVSKMLIGKVFQCLRTLPWFSFRAWVYTGITLADDTTGYRYHTGMTGTTTPASDISYASCCIRPQ
jgi:hypothetical protein